MRDPFWSLGKANRYRVMGGRCRNPGQRHLFLPCLSHVVRLRYIGIPTCPIGCVSNLYQTQRLATPGLRVVEVRATPDSKQRGPRHERGMARILSNG